MTTKTKAPSRQSFKPVVGPRSHGNCKNTPYDCFRPGKTARDKALGANRIGPNQRFPK